MTAPRKNRKNPRAQVALVARYRSPTAFEFVQEECFDLSLGGMFIRSPAPAPAGTLIKLECDVNGAAGTIRGVARVVWLREHSADGQPAGMGVKFVKLDTGAREVIAAILEQLGAERDDRDTARPPAPQGAEQPFKKTPSAQPEATKGAPGASATTSATTSASPSTSTGGSGASRAQTKAGPSPLPSAPAVSDSGRPGARDLRERLEQAKKQQSEHEATAVRSADAVRNAVAKEQSADARQAQKPQAQAQPKPQAQSQKPAAQRPQAQKPQVAAVQPVAAAATQVNAGSRAFGYALVAVLAAGVLALGLTRKEVPAKTTSASAMQPEVPASPVQAPAPPPQYVLEIATTPDGARVTAGARELTSPGQLDLGQLDEPVQLSAALEGYEPATATIDRVGFMLEDGAMRRRIELTLSAKAVEPEPAPVEQPVAAPAPTPAPEAKPAKKVAAKAETKSARRARDASNAPAAAAQPVATAEPIATAVTPPPEALVAAAPAATAAAPEPKPELTPVLTITTAGEAKPMPEAKPAPAPAPKPVVEAKPAPEPKKPEGKLTPMQAAAACLTTGDNACVVQALEGSKAKTAQELELLIETYKTMGNPAGAEKWMKVYVDKYPTERRTNAYRRVLERPKQEAAAAP